MDRWDLLIFAVAAYIAIMTLARLMVGRRNELVKDVQVQVEHQLKKNKAAARKKKKQQVA